MFKFGDNIATNVNGYRLRQDEIDKGISPQHNENELILTLANMSDNGVNIESSNFNILFEQNTKVYLTQCLTFAHMNNARFQQEMKSIFTRDTNAYYQSAPVKTHDRCVIKCSTDYGGRSFPSVACIVDMLRFSVTYPNFTTMINGMNNFIDLINNNQIRCILGNGKGIIRIKNGFKNVNKWRSFSDAEYCDIKLNVIYINELGTQCMIVECQFLVSFLLKAKKIGHKLYAIKRRYDYVNAVSNETHNVDGDYEKYKAKINQMIQTNDNDNLISQLFLQPNLVLSIINGSSLTYYPLLHSIGSHMNDKLWLLFLNCLIHFGIVILGENIEKNSDENDINKSFLKKYINYNTYTSAVIGYTIFVKYNCVHQYS